MNTKGQSISRVRNTLKTVKEDPFMTDRYIYSLLLKYAKTLVKRESRQENIYKHKSLFKEVSCIELIEVDRVDACCAGIQTGCTFRRTKDKLPKLLEVDSGPVIRAVSTIDYSTSATETLPTLYTNMTKSSTFKYNKGKYFWIVNGYLYIPEVEWEAVRLQAIFEDDVNGLSCDEEPPKCTNEQDKEFAIPEHLYSEVEQMARQEILTAGQIPSDGPDDGQNVMR